ncbi:hypothetical protein SAMN05421821_105187 [Mucilaginibacter lappiensis]|uniref:Uncharacterized protein n=1 Tax=Mucilaginibacter lappiensis TaxID=354630 RepID=A0ABR6PKM5_9SPHI|nr:hypothetical protein [Mucilaginibacter lappiensis]MBB6109769.1 hypothetical protein [Mucilaginibacter lappiensis]SIR14914.1 hypothetical protein SAMN05421821_105187 [Mucilaginibacter lappiensis]
MASRLKPNNQAKFDLISSVCDTALRIIHNSSFYGSELWPTGGFKANSQGGTDCIGYCVNAFGYELTPKTGRFVIYMCDDYDEERKEDQFGQIKLLLDYAYYNDILFEDEFRGVTVRHDHHWFKFTYTPKAE